MLMLVTPEDNSQSSPNNVDGSPSKDPLLTNQNNGQVLPTASPPIAEKEPLPTHASSSTQHQPTKSVMAKNLVKGLVLLVILVGFCTGAYYLGKHHEKVVVKAPPTQPINLPPQAIVLTNCVPGRGKQYIIPKDIPNGPIYDVENSKVIAIEYNLNIADLFQNSDTFSNAILSVTKTYPVNHLSIEPATTSLSSSGSTNQNSQSSLDIHLIMFMVPKSEADQVTCGPNTSQSPKG
ncbi:MAG: hypothetical protein ACYCPS_04285 [Candidatus Saccharimonadales bacterium]